MIISRTPFRISFFGGGTDYPVWYKEHKGAVIGATINKYCYITCRYLPPFFDYKFRIRYTKREETSSIPEIKHPSVRECLKFLEYERGVEIQHNGDLPAMSGLGSSSAFTVGLLNALYALKGRMTTKRQLALNAIHVEQDIIRESVGSQDQTHAAFGGFNKIEFGGPQEISVFPIPMEHGKLASLQGKLMLFFTGFSRIASDVAADKIEKIGKKNKDLKRMTEITDEALKIINSDDREFKGFGKLLDEQWKIKRDISDLISNQRIDEIYEEGLSAGAEGGKLLGAGGGGFMLFFVKSEYQEKVKQRLKGLLHVPFGFENLGSQIIYYAPPTNF
ncbi:MAG: kinase [Elusimicrobia bacterium]|nr:kinase [Elusimicrobiota bacterium]